MASRDARRERVRHSRAHPYSRDEEACDRDDFCPESCIKVSAASNVKTVAGKIAHMCRRGEPPTIWTTGSRPMNQAVKALAIANSYLEDSNMEVCFRPSFRDRDSVKNPSQYPVSFLLEKTTGIRRAESKGEVELLVSSQSRPCDVGGALAARIREKKRVCLTMIGVEAVANGVVAIGDARAYLEEDGYDLSIKPVFIRVDKNGVEMSAVKFLVQASSLEL